MLAVGQEESTIANRATRVPASFRDPAGFVFERDGTLYRQVNPAGRDAYDRSVSTGLFAALMSDRLLVSHEEVADAGFDEKAYQVLRPQRIPFISYPYEWPFSALKAAALTTLEVQRLAIRFGMTLKDASASNVQFIGPRPLFIDSLSFEPYKPGPWIPYRQFCRPFPRAVGHDELLGLCVDTTAARCS